MAQGPVGLNFPNISQVLSKSMAVVHQPQRSNNKGHFESSHVSADLMGTQLSSKQSPKNCKHCSVPTFFPLKYNSAVSLQQEFTYKENQKLVTSQFSGTLNKVSMDFKTVTSKFSYFLHNNSPRSCAVRVQLRVHQVFKQENPEIIYSSQQLQKDDLKKTPHLLKPACNFYCHLYQRSADV